MKTNTITLFVTLVAMAVACGESNTDNGTSDSSQPTLQLPKEGSAYSVDINSGQWITPNPQEIQGIVKLLADEYPFFAGIHRTQSETVDLMLATAISEAPEKQQLCNRTVIMEGLTYAKDRVMVFGPSDFTIANGTKAKDLTMTFSFNESMEAIENIEMEATVLLDTIPPDMLPLPDGVTVCDLLADLSIDCLNCNGEPCLKMHVKGVTAKLQNGLNLESIDTSDCHKDCAESKDNKDCQL